MEAKKWQDTVVKIKCHCQLYYQECSCPCDDCTRIKTTTQAREEQAELSFKAGEQVGIEARRKSDLVWQQQIEQAVAKERERVFGEVEEMLGIPKTDKVFRMTVTIYSEQWQAVKRGEVKR